jgi:hypothetical protein
VALSTTACRRNALERFRARACTATSRKYIHIDPFPIHDDSRSRAITLSGVQKLA